MPLRKPRYTARNAIVYDPVLGAVQNAVPPIVASTGERYGELMSLLGATVVAEQSTHRMSQELEPNGQWCASMKQGPPFFWWQIRDGLEIERNGLLQGREDLPERASLNGDVEVEADRLPLTIPAFGVAMKRSVRQFHIPVRIVLHGA